MSIYKMNRQQIVKFCDLYKHHYCLWKSDSHEYRDRTCRANALQKISDEMSIEGFGPVHVAQKIKNLRTTYAQEIRKIRAGTPENSYKPKIVWFKIFDSFLRRYIWSKSHNNIRVNCKTEPETEEILSIEINSDDANNGTIAFDANAIDQLETITLNSQEIEKNITSTSISTSLVHNTIHDDEYNCFGNYIASSLKSLPPEFALTAQSEIVQILLREKRNALMVSTNSQW